MLGDVGVVMVFSFVAMVWGVVVGSAMREMERVGMI